MTAPKGRAGPVSQLKLFKLAARAVECDEAEAGFDKALSKIARASVPRKPVKRKKISGAERVLPHAS